MRRMLARGILVRAMLGVAGPLVCDSGCVAQAEDSRQVLKKPDFVRVPANQALEEYNPDVERERQRAFRRGDFWSPKDFNRAFPDNRVQDNPYRGFERIFPPGR